MLRNETEESMNFEIKLEVKLPLSLCAFQLPMTLAHNGLATLPVPSSVDLQRPQRPLFLPFLHLGS